MSLKGQRSGPCCHQCFGEVGRLQPRGLEALGSFIPSAEMLSIPAVSRHCARGLRPRGQAAGIIQRGTTGGERSNPPSPPPAAPFSPTASIKLCQLLPLAKPCLRETDLKGPKSARTPLWGYSATSQSGQRRNCTRRGPSPRWRFGKSRETEEGSNFIWKSGKNAKNRQQKGIKDLNVWSLHINEISKCDRRMLNFITSINIKLY